MLQICFVAITFPLFYPCAASVAVPVDKLLCHDCCILIETVCRPKPGGEELRLKGRVKVKVVSSKQSGYFILSHQVTASEICVAVQWWHLR